MTRSALFLAIVSASLAACGGLKPVAEAPLAVPNSPACTQAADLATRRVPPPPYPPEARARRQAGWAVVGYDVLRGHASKVRVMASSPSGVFDDVARAHVEGMPFPSAIDASECRMLLRWQVD